MLNIYDPRDEQPEFSQFRDLVHQSREKAYDLRGQMLRGATPAALVRLQTETTALLHEAAYLITNAPVQIHDGLGDDAFENMHQDVVDAAALEVPSPLETSDLGLVRERLSISVDLALYALDLLAESIEHIAPGEHSSVPRTRSSQAPGREVTPATPDDRETSAASDVGVPPERK